MTRTGVASWAPTVAVLTAALGAGWEARADPAPAIRLVQSKGTVIRSPERVGSVLIADPAIANVQPLSETTLFVIGKAGGATELFILDDEANVIERRGVFVTRSLADMRNAQATSTERPVSR